MWSILMLAIVYIRYEVVMGTITAGAVVLMAVKLVVVELVLAGGYSSEYANHVISEIQTDHLYQLRHVIQK